MATDDLPETFHVTTDEQLRAVSNLTRHRIMAVLRFEPATITQIAERVGLAKGSSSYHVRLLERAGLVKVVRTRKVRGVTERYYAMAARTIALPDPGEGGPDVLMRHAVADLEASPADGERHVRMAHLRLTEEQFAELGARLQALADEYRELSDPSLPDASLVFALFHPASREQAEGGRQVTSGVRKLPTGFGRLWTAQTVSSLGDGVSHAALPLLALTLTRDPMGLAVVTAAGTLPWLLFGVLGGALVDRWDRRRTMWVADAARAVLLAIPAAAAALDLLSVSLLAAVAFLLGLGGLFFDTTATAYLPDLLGRDPALLERANSRLRGTQTAMSGFAGPPAGSALLALGRAVPLLADAVSFLLSALLVRTLPAMPRPVPEVRESLLRQARAGASYVFRDRLLLGLALRPAVGNVAFLAVETVLALFAHDRLGIDTYGFGLLLTAEATGGLLGAAIASYLGRRLGTGTALTCTAAVEGLAILGLAAAPNPYVAGLALAVCGAGMGATMVLAPSLRQSIVPAHLMGRVASTSRMLAMCAAPVGAFLGGWLATAHDIRTPLYAAAGLLLAMTAVTASMTSNRRVEAALRAAAPAGGPDHPASEDPAEEGAPDVL